MSNLGTVCYQTSEASEYPTCQISSQSGNAHLSYWWFSRYSSGRFLGRYFNAKFSE